jgi:hypothetical protein
MAKMFYTLDEAKAALGKNEEEIKQYAREGKLREFRDGPRLMFKADQVEILKNEIHGGGGMDHVDLGPSDSGIAIGLADSKGGSGIGSGIGSGAGGGLSLADTDSGRSPGGGMTLKEDTALAADLGLSGSIGGMPSPARMGGSGGSMGGSLGGSMGGSVGGSMSGTGAGGSHASRSGIDVFQNDEIDRVDPAAQTAVAADHLSESVGSGSGLLDLTRESDDTSLGAELLDEIAPGGSGARKSPSESSAGGTMSGLVDAPRSIGSSSRNVSTGGAPVHFEKADPMAPAFGAAALGATLVVVFGAFALITGVLDTSPSILTQIAEKGFLVVAGGGVAVALIFFVVGLLVGKAGTR